MRPTHLGTALALAGVVLAGTACSSSSPAASTHAAAITSTVGTGCGTLPKSGTGSVTGMASQPVATAAAHNPQLTDLTQAVHLADLSGPLDTSKSITVFAPNNDAFITLERELGRTDVQKLMASQADLRDVLEYHVVSGRVTPADLASGKPLTSLLGQPLHPAKTGSTYEVNDAAVVCGNIKTANAYVYIINQVLVP
jgi:uncharacterized surface protein with fasciclin (FAS1) repeats